MIDDPTNHWALLVKSALVGTDRFQPPETTPAIMAGLPGLASDPSARLLEQACALSAMIRAAREAAPGRAPGMPELPPDDLPEAGPIATHALVRILAEYQELVREWCTAAQGRRRVPDHVLPSFLDHLARERTAATREAMQAVLGVRGSWLAAMNPAWGASSTAADALEAWRTGLKAQRLAALARIRRAEPARARDLLRDSLTQESPEDVVDFIGVFAERLSMDDHEFLESLLDARARTVRTAAGDLLARLPESARSQRNAARAALRLTFERTPARLLRKEKTAIKVTLADTDDASQAKALARDGIDVGRKRGTLGPKAVTLAQIIAGTPLAWFTGTWSATPAEILDAALDGEWAEALVNGFTEAAVVQRNETWALALLDRFAGAAGELVKTLEHGLVPLFQALSPQRREAFVLGVVEARPLAIHEAWMLALLGQLDHAWSADFTARLVKVFMSHLLHEQHWSVRTLISKLHPYMNPSVAVDNGWPETSNGWGEGDRQMLAHLTSALALRRNYLKELTA